MKFSIKDRKASEGGSSYMPAPCVAVCVLEEVNPHISSRKGTPGVELIHRDQQGRIANTKLWLSKNSIDNTMDVVTIMGDRLGMRDQINEAVDKADSYETFALAVKKVFEGVEAAWLFSAEEVWIEEKDENGDPTGNYGEKPWMKPVLNQFGTFVRPIDQLESLKEDFDRAGEERFIKRTERPEDANPSPSFKSSDGADW